MGNTTLVIILVVAAYGLGSVSTWWIIELLRDGWKGDANSFALVTNMIGQLQGGAMALAVTAVNYKIGTSASSAKKDETIQTMAGKG